MQSSLISFGRSLISHWLLIAAGAFLLSMLFLVGNLYSSQVELRQDADARLVSFGKIRATAIGDFLIGRRQAAERLASSEDIANYFSNLDLGMSVKYELSPIWLQSSAAFSRLWTGRNIRANRPTCGWLSSTTTASFKLTSARPARRHLRRRVTRPSRAFKSMGSAA